MATRYSGNAAVHVRWSDPKQGYEVSVSVAGRMVWCDLLDEQLGPPADSPEAYDEVARITLTFMDDTQTGDIVRPARDQHGLVEVSRTRTVDAIAAAADRQLCGQGGGMTRMDRLVAAGLILSIWTLAAAAMYWFWATHAGG